MCDKGGVLAGELPEQNLGRCVNKWILRTTYIVQDERCIPIECHSTAPCRTAQTLDRQTRQDGHAGLAIDSQTTWPYACNWIETAHQNCADRTFRTLFPGALRVFSRSALKRAWTGHREPLQNVSLSFFLSSCRPPRGWFLVRLRAACAYRRRRASGPLGNGLLPSVWPSHLWPPEACWLLLWPSSSR
jgi:hypothetical protein